MAWTAPLTWSTSQIVTASQLNEQIRDNETYLYGMASSASTSITILMNPIVASTDNSASAVYQNTTSYERKISVVAGPTTTNNVYLLMGSTNTVGIISAGQSFGVGGTAVYQTVIGFIPPSYYYSVTTPAPIWKWVEWNYSS